MAYKFKKDHIKILDKDVKVVIKLSDPDLSFQGNRYDWDLRIWFYLHRKLKWLPAKLDETHYAICSTKECTLDHNFDITGLFKKYCREYKQNLIEKRQEKMANSQLQQCLSDWDGSYEEEGDGK